MKQTMIIFGSLLACLTLVSFINKNKDTLKLPKSFYGKFAQVPSGRVIIESDTFKVNDFYISKEEVTNREYREFLSEISNSEYAPRLQSILVDF